MYIIFRKLVAYEPQGTAKHAPIGLTLWILSLHGMTRTSVTLFLPLLLQVVHRGSPVVINFLGIVISMGWPIGTFTLSGGVSALRSHRGLASLTAVALLPGLALMTLSVFTMGIGIGVYNVHLVAWAMDSVAFSCIPFGLAALLMFRFVRIALGKPEAVSARGGW